MTAGELIRAARVEAGISQAALARRLGLSQPAVARLEAAGDAITVDKLKQTLAGLGRSLELDAPTRPSSVDETLLVEQLKLAPGERLEEYDGVYAGVREFALAVRK